MSIWAEGFRTDAAPRGRKGKPCGRGHIAADYNCGKNNRAKTAAKVALGAGLTAAAVYGLSRRSKPPVSSFASQAALSGRAARPPAALPGTPRPVALRGSTPKGLLPPGTKRVSSGVRMAVEEEIAKWSDWEATELSSNVKHNFIVMKFSNPEINGDIRIGFKETPEGDLVRFRLQRYRGAWDTDFKVNGEFARMSGKKSSMRNTVSLFSGLERMLQSAMTGLDDREIIHTSAFTADGAGPGRERMYRRFGFRVTGKDDYGNLLSATVGDLRKRSRRTDAAPRDRRRGKPCGRSHISRDFNCGQADRNRARATTAAKVALGVGLAAGGTALLRNRLTRERAARIAEEALTSGQIWQPQERINARRLTEIAAECGRAPALAAPTKFDAYIDKPRCRVGSGSFGTYYVHPSRKFGVKAFTDPDESTAEWEFNRLSEAHANGVNCPEPLATNYTKDGRETLVTTHMEGYRNIGDQYWRAAHDNHLGATPLIVRLKAAREFRKLHRLGIAHGDIHDSNILIHPKSRRIALIDFGYSTFIDDSNNPVNFRDGMANFKHDFRRVPLFLGLSSTAMNPYTDTRNHIFDLLNAAPHQRDWDQVGLAVNRYYDAMEREIKRSSGITAARSRRIGSIEQLRLPLA